MSPHPPQAELAPSWVVVGPGAPDTVGAFLIARFAHVPPEQWRDRLARGRVRDADDRPLHADTPTHPGQRIRYTREVPQETPIAAQEVVLFEDDRLLVVDKPHGLPVQPSGRYLSQTVLMRQRQRLGNADLAPLHRIDRDTAGLVLLVKQPAWRDAYSALFRQHAVAKTYEAVVPWHAGLVLPPQRSSRIGVGAHFMQMTELPGAPNAQTDLALLAVHGAWALLQLRPRTGQRHQLRVHLAALGLPIRHDAIYPVLQPEGSADPSRPLQLLARRLAFTDPATGQPRVFESQRQLDWPPRD